MNPVAFYISGMPIYWYGIIMALSILAAVLVGVWLCRRLGYKDEIPYEVMIAAVPLGVLGARLYYILFSGGNFADFFDFRSGGIAIYGGVIAAALGILLYTRFVRRCGFFAISDMLAIGGILAQSLGRWGNFFNQEVYGFETGFHFFPLTVLGIDGSPHLALFFYESILNLLGFVLLLKILSKQKKIGTVSAAYLIYYGCVRAVLEPLREDAYTLMIGPIPVSLLVSILAVALGLLILYLNRIGKISQKNAALYREEDNTPKANEPTSNKDKSNAKAGQTHQGTHKSKEKSGNVRS